MVLRKFMYNHQLYHHQIKAIEESNKYKKCLINMWCGTGKTRTFTIDLFLKCEKMNVIVFPSLGLINIVMIMLYHVKNHLKQNLKNINV